MTAEDRREKTRLRSERWRRAHGIEPRRPAQRPWLAEGISRSTWYRRRKQAREREALVTRVARNQAMFDMRKPLRWHWPAISRGVRWFRGLDRGACADVPLLRWHPEVAGSRQPEERRQQGPLLRSRDQPHLLGRWAAHYSVGILPARPYKPRDKAKVEAGVRFAQDLYSRAITPIKLSFR